MRCEAWPFEGEVELYIGHRGTEPTERWLSPALARELAAKLVAAAERVESDVPQPSDGGAAAPGGEEP